MSVHPISADDSGETGSFAALLRRFRSARRMSQMDLALECDVSARHVSFLESGRAQPSREMVLQLASGLVLPRSARNLLLQSAGFVPAFPRSPLESDALGPFRDVLAEMIARHSPYPALLCDRHWNVRDANRTARALLAPLQGPGGAPNVVRLLTGNPQVSDLIANLPEVLDDMLGRIQLEALEAVGDPVLDDLLRSLEAACARLPHKSPSPVRRPLSPLLLNSPAGPLSFLSTIAHFGTSEDVTVRDLRLELLFPTDARTREAMAAIAAEPGD
ncbi:MAG: helix-turn-helix transcriptional regulator [Alphaproteobacteria bacterium]|nr:helix-turn-helix transcriptional regulator [Alphaproteobacteria bacterium]